MKKQLLFLLTFVIANILFAQDSSFKKDKEIILSVGPSATKLINMNIDKDEYKNVDNQLGLNVSFIYSKYFKNRIGIGIGVEYSSYGQTIYQNGLFEKKNQTDRDNYTYDLWMKSNMTYTANLKYMDVPIMLHILLGKPKQFYGFIDAGIVNSFLIDGKYTKKGSIENMGDYPTSNPYFDIVSQNNPYYGYEYNYFNSEYNEKYETHNVSFRVSFGIAATMTNRTYLCVAPEIMKGLSDVICKDDRGKDYENIFGDKLGYKATKTYSLGLNIGFVFNL